MGVRLGSLRVLCYAILLAALLSVPLTAVACGSSSSAGDTSIGSSTATIVEPTDAAADSNIVAWSEASAHIGESVTIEGPVAGAVYAESSNGSPTFLNIGADYPDESRFTVVIWGENRGNFTLAPEDQYAGQTIRVTGTVSDYQGVPQIEAASPGDIEIVQ